LWHVAFTTTDPMAYFTRSQRSEEKTPELHPLGSESRSRGLNGNNIIILIFFCSFIL
jgi:hypothetical protein